MMISPAALPAAMAIIIVLLSPSFSVVSVSGRAAPAVGGVGATMLGAAEGTSSSTDTGDPVTGAVVFAADGDAEERYVGIADGLPEEAAVGD